MKTNYPKTLAIAVGVTAFVAFFATFASLSRARAGDVDDFALFAVGLIECYPELRADPARNSVLGKITDMIAQYPEAERVAAGEKAFTMVRQDTARFCRSVAMAVSQLLNK